MGRQALGESGFLGLCATEACGGSGLGVCEALPVLLEAGRHAAPYPVGDAMFASHVLSQAPQHRDLARQVITGAALVAVADEPSPGIQAERGPDGWRISGCWDAVAWASQASHMLVRLTLESRVWVCVDLQATGVRLTPRTPMDLTTPVARVALDDHAVPQANRVADDDARLGRMRGLLAAADMQGSAQACLDLAVAWMKERQQFGQPIGRFQALKHIAAESALRLENMRVANAWAAWAHDADDAQAEDAWHIAKSYASEHARRVAEDALQCHGGMGYTWEYGLHFFLRRIVRLGATAGTAHAHREALMADLLQRLDTAPA